MKFGTDINDVPSMNLSDTGDPQPPDKILLNIPAKKSQDPLHNLKQTFVQIFMAVG